MGRAPSWSEVARRHGISPQHLFAWRKAARAGLLSLLADEAPVFVPVVTEPRPAGASAEAVTRSPTTITIEIGGAVVRAKLRRYVLGQKARQSGSCGSCSSRIGASACLERRRLDNVA
jgi:transposase-like protein